MDKQELVKIASEMREKSYVPYSSFRVGAALLGKSGKVYTGCNIESASYSPTICAERTAIAKGVSSGERDFSAIAVVGDGEYTFPCGVCRQMLREFGKDLLIHIGDRQGRNIRTFTLEELLPHSFGPESLEEI